MPLVWCRSGRLALAQDTHICGGVSTCLVLGAILLDMWCSNDALVLLTVVAAPAFSSFQELGLSTPSFMAKRGIFIEIHSSSLNNTSGVSTGIIFMSQVGTRDFSWDMVADLWIEPKNLDTWFWVQHPAFHITNRLLQALSYLSPLMD